MGDISFIKNILGSTGIVIVTGILVFIFCLRYSRDIFNWIEHQTLGTRTYILEKLELLFIEIDPDRLTMWLTIFSLFLSSSSLFFFGLTVSWILGFVVATILGIFSFRVPKVFVDFLVRRRKKQYAEQMVDGLTLLANGIRAGLSVPQALGMVVSELSPPISQEFNMILQQNRIGVTLEECFENLTKRVPTEDNDMFVSAINILRETGGNLAEVFDTIVSVIRERIRLQQKIDTYIAQGMIQAIIIASMPFAIGLVYTISTPESMLRAVTNPIGILMLGGAFVLDAIGVFIIVKLVQIDV